MKNATQELRAKAALRYSNAIDWNKSYYEQSDNAIGDLVELCIIFSYRPSKTHLLDGLTYARSLFEYLKSVIQK